MVEETKQKYYYKLFIMKEKMHLKKQVLIYHLKSFGSYTSKSISKDKHSIVKSLHRQEPRAQQTAVYTGSAAQRNQRERADGRRGERTVGGEGGVKMEQDNQKGDSPIKDLWRPETLPDSCDKVIIIGNGAVKNGWETMIPAIQKTYPYNEWTLERIKSVADLIPATAVHLYNLERMMLLAPVDIETCKNWNFDKLKGFFDLMNNIGTAYNCSLYFQTQIDFITSQVTAETAAITLNYDNSVWNYKVNGEPLFKNLMYLHGRASVPESLYFPTDNTVYDDIKDVTKIIEDSDKQEQAKKAIEDSLDQLYHKDQKYLIRRYDSLTTDLREMHYSAISWLEKASEIIVWGVGLNAYDSELLSILMSVNCSDKKLTVINPDGKTAEKTRMLLNIKKENYKWIAPKISFAQ